MDGATVYVSYGDERARVYSAGGIGFDQRIRGIGWVVDDEPSPVIERLAYAVRDEAFPFLEPKGRLSRRLAELEGGQ
jgi:hypothetical protein